MIATRWWSASKKEWVVLEEMHDNHLLAAQKKLERGEYLVPDSPDDRVATRTPHPGELMHLKSTFDAEMKRRQIGPYAPAEA